MMNRRLLVHARRRLGRSLGRPQSISRDRKILCSCQFSSKTYSNSESEPSTTTHFGFEQVRVHEKESRVRQVFENVAESYDIMNDFMSGGLHRIWKDYFVDQTKVSVIAEHFPQGGEPFQILDVAGGTGDIAFRMVDAAETKNVTVTVCDINAEMLRVGERRALEKYDASLLSDDAPTLRFVEGNAQSLTQLQDNSFDLYTIAFGLRNVTDVDLALEEAHRVLKPGGRFMCLEFSHVPNEMLRAIYDMYSFQVIPAMGQVVASDRASYQYLVESIRQFSNQQELLERLEKAGFQNVRYTNLTGGIVAIHEGWKSL
jgi:ubiquinone/menaquinone biosynthesis methyltransferase